MYGGNGHFQYSKGNNSKSRKTIVTVHVFCMSSHGVSICVKFHENMSSGFKVMEQTQKLLTDTHTQKENYILHCMHTSYAGVPVYLAPWTGCPPGGNLSRDILPPTLVTFTPGGQHIPAGLSCPPGVKLNQPGYLAPHP